MYQMLKTIDLNQIASVPNVEGMKVVGQKQMKEVVKWESQHFGECDLGGCVIHRVVFKALGLYYGTPINNIDNAVLYEFKYNHKDTGLPWDIVEHCSVTTN